MAPHAGHARLFMAEDNPGDVTLMLAAIEEVGLSADLEVATDGASAVSRLLDSSHSVPDMIILNFNLPKMRGDEVLGEIKHCERLRGVPVVMLTSSDADRERLLCEKADAYFVKSGDWDQLIEITKNLRDFVGASPSRRMATRQAWADHQTWRLGNPGIAAPSTGETRSRSTRFESHREESSP